MDKNPMTKAELQKLVEERARKLAAELILDGIPVDSLALRVTIAGYHSKSVRVEIRSN